MRSIDRRNFLQGAAAIAGGAIVGGPLQQLLAGPAGAIPFPNDPLVPVPDLRDGKVRLWLPRRFQYRSFHDTDGPPVILRDGTTLPGRHDGMGAFPASSGRVWLVRNHEVNGPGPAFGPSAPTAADAPYDAMARGGTTTVLATTRGEVLDSFTSLNGTQMNCSGGVMPWGSWITCEETVNGPDVGADFTGAPNTALQARHGFIFEVPAGGKSDRQPIRAAGRFAHEAAVFSPLDGQLYLTEDNFGFPSGLYRYRPPRSPLSVGRVEDGGVLQMLRVVGTPNAHLEGTQVVGARYTVDWVTIADPDPTFPYTPGQPAPTSNNAAISYVGDQGRAAGAAHFSRLEGATYANGEIWFTSTQGGGAAETGPDTVLGYGNGFGQLWSYNPRTNTLTCRYQSPGAASLDFPDNVTAAPKTGRVFVCEDGTGDNFVRMLGPDSRMYDAVLNRLTANATGAPRFGEEFAGATFSPDGGTMFVNIQANLAISFAIWGPWYALDTED